MPKYGLTGGIASGKTVALQIFNEYGVDTIDTDELARLVIDRGTEGARKLVPSPTVFLTLGRRRRGMYLLLPTPNPGLVFLQRRLVLRSLM